MFSSVDLPLPDGPISAMNSPSRSEIHIAQRAHGRRTGQSCAASTDDEVGHPGVRRLVGHGFSVRADPVRNRRPAQRKYGPVRQLQELVGRAN